MTTQAGIAETDITPPVGLDLTGGAFGPSTEILHPLKAKVLYLANPTERILLVSCDLLGFDWDRALRIRQDIEKRFGIPTDSIMLACTHTHSAAATVTLRNWGRVDEGYCADVHKIVEAAGQALKNTQPIKIGAAKQGCPGVAKNRIDDEGAVNDFISTIRIDNASGEILALLVTFACHPVNLHSSKQISPDFPYYLEQKINSSLGKTTPLLYLSGAGGDINPANFEFNPSEKLARETGETLAAKVLEHLGKIKTTTVSELKSITENCEVLYQPLPEKGELEAIIERDQEVLDGLEDRSWTNWKFTGRKSSVEWAKEALDVLERDRPETSRTIPIQAFQIGEAAIVAMPGELFTEFGLRIENDAAFKHITVATQSNGTFGYYPNRQAFAKKSYEAAHCPRFLGTYFYQEDVGERVCEASLKALARLARKA